MQAATFVTSSAAPDPRHRARRASRTAAAALAALWLVAGWPARADDSLAPATAEGVEASAIPMTGETAPSEPAHAASEPAPNAHAQGAAGAASAEAPPAGADAAAVGAAPPLPAPWDGAPLMAAPEPPPPLPAPTPAASLDIDPAPRPVQIDLAAIDNELEEIRLLVEDAHYRTALAIGDSTRALLERERGHPEADLRRTRLGVLTATAAIALGRSDEAARYMADALQADPDLDLDPSTTSPKVRAVLADLRRPDPRLPATEAEDVPGSPLGGSATP